MVVSDNVTSPPTLPTTTMDTALSGSRLNEEKAFATRFTAGLESHPVNYPIDFVTPLEERPRKVQVLSVGP